MRHDTSCNRECHYGGEPGGVSAAIDCTVWHDLNGVSSGAAGANPDQTNTYKADGGIWLILFWTRLVNFSHLTRLDAVFSPILAASSNSYPPFSTVGGLQESTSRPLPSHGLRRSPQGIIDREVSQTQEPITVRLDSPTVVCLPSHATKAPITQHRSLQLALKEFFRLFMENNSRTDFFVVYHNESDRFD